MERESSILLRSGAGLLFIGAGYRATLLHRDVTPARFSAPFAREQSDGQSQR